MRDPRAKVLFALVSIVGVTLTPERAWLNYGLWWLFFAAVTVLSGLSPWKVIRRAALALPFALAALTLTFTTPGTPVVLGMTDNGLARFVSIGIKSSLAVHGALILTMTTPFDDILWALRWLKLPGTLVTIFAFTYRYLFVLREEGERLLRARASRGGETSRRGVLWRAQTAGYLVGSLFLRTYERSERIYLAMLARGYSGDLHASESPPLPREAVLFVMVSAALIAFIRSV